jgi:hypothetical protein
MLATLFVTDCCRCGRRRCKAGSWPDGHVCRTCHDRALRTQGRCPGCGDDRVLPGLRLDGAAVCTDCAGFTTSFRCSRCPAEGKLHAGRLCTRCTLHDRLTDLLGCDSGGIRPELAPLATSLLSAPRPLSILTWLHTRKGKTESPELLLRQLGRGEIPLTHEAFHTLRPWRAAAHLRELLMACDVLPRLDKQICSLERWLTGHLDTITDPAHTQLVHRFAAWEVLPRLRNRAEHTPLTPAARRFAGEQIKLATRFLTWHAVHRRALDTCRQADIDTWHAEHNEHARNRVRRRLRVPAGTDRPRSGVRVGGQPDRHRAPGRSIPADARLQRCRPSAGAALLRPVDRSLDRGHGRGPVGGPTRGLVPRLAVNPTGRMRSCFLALRIRPANRHIHKDPDGNLPECWLLAERPASAAEPTDYWLSTLPGDIRLRTW